MARTSEKKFNLLQVDEVISVLRWKLARIDKAEKEREAVFRRYASQRAAADEIATVIEEQIADYYADVCSTLNFNLVQYPSCHARHFAALARFYETYDYEKSIFIMTKFSDGDDIEKDKDLEKVISCTEKHIKECGYAPRIARASSRYHDSLWDNVELHLLGCSRGIAIVEDRSKGEFNPNVAMEWGFMRALGKPVLYLEERGFKHRRADWSGLLRDQFDWDNPEDGIKKAVANWLRR